jgi:FMN-dependent oxidoreductase (nitrilotriacetate monooxygenase family)
LISGLVSVTEHLGLAFTSGIMQNHPYGFARSMATLDHLSKGRIAWNIVTSYLESAAKGFGLEELVQHDDRYARAQEYCEVLYKLWEGSWEDDAAIRDKKNRIFTDPDKVHFIEHNGEHYNMNSIAIFEPSPQRTPVLYQAGTSPAGKAFAAKNAECIFLINLNPKLMQDQIVDINRIAKELGRPDDSIQYYAYVKVITGATQIEAQEKFDSYYKDIDYDAALSLVSTWMGIDFSEYEPDQPLEYIETNALRSLIEGFTTADPSRKWLMKDLAKYMGMGIGPVIVGDPGKVADELQTWIDHGAHGFNLACAVRPGTMEDFVRYCVPELQDRGMMQTEYKPGTMREKLFGHARLQAPHPATLYRR